VNTTHQSAPNSLNWHCFPKPIGQLYWCTTWQGLSTPIGRSNTSREAIVESIESLCTVTTSDDERSTSTASSARSAQPEERSHINIYQSLGLIAHNSQQCGSKSDSPSRSGANPCPARLPSCNGPAPPFGSCMRPQAGWALLQSRTPERAMTPRPGIRASTS
jgi:hypothetical protein